MNKFKCGDKVKLVSNACFSSHNIGDIGQVIEVKAKPLFKNKRGYEYSYLISVNGYSNPAGTWSYELDLARVVQNVNINTTIL